MNLTVSGQIITPIELKFLAIKALLGSFELSFHFKCTVNPIHEGRIFEIVVSAARVFWAPPGADSLDLGVARADEIVAIRQTNFVSSQEFVLKLPMLPHQIDLLEAARAGGDLSFKLDFKYRGGVKQGAQGFEQAEETSIPVNVPESSWVKQLNQSGADKLLLFEIRLPHERDLAVIDPAAQHLILAQMHFTEGNYTEAVFQCRKVTEELLRNRTKTVFEEFQNGAARAAMTKDDREDYLISALQLYSHQAAHSGSKDGETYNRAEAKMALTVAAAVVGQRFGRPSA